MQDYENSRAHNYDIVRNRMNRFYNTNHTFETVTNSKFSITVVVFEKRYCRFEHGRLVHFPVRRWYHCVQLVDQQVELIPPFLLAQIASFPATNHKIIIESPGGSTAIVQYVH